VLPGKFTMTVRNGDVLRHVLAGAGGWGDPLERDPGAVLRDVRNELLSPAKARVDYGVIVDTKRWAVDAAATEAERARIRAARRWREVPKVQRHDPLPAERAKA
jgi:N-methylhydantoinase B